MKNVSLSAGFTLLELLIVVVIIGILATLALPRFGNVQEKAMTATLQSDLRNLVTAQALHAAEDAAAAIIPGDALGQHASANVTLAYQDEANHTATSYVVTASHSKSDIACTLTIAPSAAHEITCDGEPVGAPGGDEQDPEAPQPSGYVFNSGITTYTRASGDNVSIPAAWAVPVEMDAKYARMSLLMPDGGVRSTLYAPISGGTASGGMWSMTEAAVPNGTGYRVQVSIHNTLSDAMAGSGTLATATSEALTISY